MAKESISQCVAHDISRLWCKGEVWELGCHGIESPLLSGSQSHSPMRTYAHVLSYLRRDFKKIFDFFGIDTCFITGVATHATN